MTSNGVSGGAGDFLHDKGLPESAVALEAIGKRGWNVLREDLTTPVAVLKQSSLRANAKWMQDFCALADVSLAPHGKTTMSPELLKQIVSGGAWGLTCATVHHLEIYRLCGVQRVIFANQLVGTANLRMALRHIKDPAFELYILVDSSVGIRLLADAGRDLDLQRPINVLVEVGVAGQRTGVRSLQEGLDLAVEIAREPTLALRGVETFEGVYGHAPPEQALEAADAMLNAVCRLAEAIDHTGLFAPGEVILSAGGSDFFDRAIAILKQAKLKSPPRVVIRSGCSVTHDHLHYERAFERMRARQHDVRFPAGGLQPALEVWAHVQSIPEVGRIICNLGKRDISYDWELPQPVLWRPRNQGAREAPLEHTTIALNDQHLFLSAPANTPVVVGDMMGFGVSHPCTTFDKWRVIPVIDDDYEVVGAVRTCF